MPKIIVVNRHIIRKNKQIPVNQQQAPIRVSKGKYGKPKYYFEYEIRNGIVKYDPISPLPCGATVWIETK